VLHRWDAQRGFLSVWRLLARSSRTRLSQACYIHVARGGGRVSPRGGVARSCTNEGRGLVSY
jgi:hypothetical protein